MVELEQETFHEKELKRWWGSFSCKDQAYIKLFLGDATSVFCTSLDWHLLEAITTCWDPALRCITICEVDLVPTLEEYDCFLALSTLVSWVYQPPVRTSYCKRLAKLLSLKRLVDETLTQYRNGLGGSMPFDFLFDWFRSTKCPVAYWEDFVDLKEHWVSYRCQAFMVAFFGTVLFPSQLGSISFAILPLVSTLPHSISFVPALLFETVRSLSLCCETGSGRLGCCVHLLQLWFCSHLSMIARA